MKKILSILFCLVTLPVFSIVIDANTQLKWNSHKLDDALSFAGYNCDRKGDEICKKYHKIMVDLLERETFSVSDAVSVCMKYCEDSDFKPSQKSSKVDTCADVCRYFGKELAYANNYGQKRITYASEAKIYSADRQFFAVIDAGTKNGCFGAVFDTTTNKQVAECVGEWDSELIPYTLYFKKIDNKYNGPEFSVFCNTNIVENFLRGVGLENINRCSLTVTYTDEFIRNNFYDYYYKPCADAFKKVDFTELHDIVLTGIFPIQDEATLLLIYGAEGVFDFDKVNVSVSDPDYQKYCKPLEKFSVGGPGQPPREFNISAYISKKKQSFLKAQAFFQDESRYANKKFSGYANAERFIEKDFKEFTNLDSDIKCQSDPFDGGVECKLGKMKITFDVSMKSSSSDGKSSSSKSPDLIDAMAISGMPPFNVAAWAIEEIRDR